MKENKEETLIEEISDKESEMIKGGIQICIRPSIPFLSHYFTSQQRHYVITS
ncbi:hypothetical protein [Dolichospermum sp. UHCC 0406]|uniref:hypothetical protein n=1 Tax=Dolichospermum sp. UHCC 0406 TaxID=2590017 RepID=UPI001C2BE68A|nr:hypothetical protein [Dolichospermum sp. UHCC 0406]